MKQPANKDGRGGPAFHREETADVKQKHVGVLWNGKGQCAQKEGQMVVSDS